MIAQKALPAIAGLGLIGGVAGCSWQEPAIDPPSREAVTVLEGPADETGVAAARFAYGQLGVPYRFGGESPQSGFDCSGLVHYAYGQAGRVVPRTTAGLNAATRDVDRRALKAGDLLFFKIDGKVRHVGIYLDRGRFVHAPQTGRTVSVESLDSGFYRETFLRGGRFAE